MRIAGIGAEGDVRRRIADQSFVLEPVDHLLLKVVLGQPLAASQRLARALEGAILDAIERLGRAHVRRALRRRPRSLEVLDQIARRDDVYAARANQLRGPRVDAREIRDRAQWRIFHRDASYVAQEVIEARRQLFTPRIRLLLTGQRVEVVPLDLVHERARRAGRGNQVVPPPRGHVPPVGEPCQPGGDRVGPVKVVEEPAVQVIGAKALLDRGHVERHDV